MLEAVANAAMGFWMIVVIAALVWRAWVAHKTRGLNVRRGMTPYRWIVSIGAALAIAGSLFLAMSADLRGDGGAAADAAADALPWAITMFVVGHVIFFAAVAVPISRWWRSRVT